MGEDLGRFLADEPIRARQVARAERYWRWADVNQRSPRLGGVLTVVLVLVTIGSLLAANRLRDLAHAEQLARHEASRQAKAESIAHRRRRPGPWGGREGKRSGAGRDLLRRAQRGKGTAGR